MRDTRATKHRAIAAFDMLKNALGPIANDWTLDYSSVDGGYKIVNDSTGMLPVLAGKRLRTKDFTEACQFTVACINCIKNTSNTNGVNNEN